MRFFSGSPWRIPSGIEFLGNFCRDSLKNFIRSHSRNSFDYSGIQTRIYLGIRWETISGIYWKISSNHSLRNSLNNSFRNYMNNSQSSGNTIGNFSRIYNGISLGIFSMIPCIISSIICRIIHLVISPGFPTKIPHSFFRDFLGIIQAFLENFPTYLFGKFIWEQSLGKFLEEFYRGFVAEFPQRLLKTLSKTSLWISSGILWGISPYIPRAIVKRFVEDFFRKLLHSLIENFCRDSFGSFVHIPWWISLGTWWRISQKTPWGIISGSLSGISGLQQEFHRKMFKRITPG